jgi:hypothetical protein
MTPGRSLYLISPDVNVEDDPPEKRSFQEPLGVPYSAPDVGHSTRSPASSDPADEK